MRSTIAFVIRAGWLWPACMALAVAQGAKRFAATPAQPAAAQEPTSSEPAITLPQFTVQDTRESYAASGATTATKIEAPILDIPNRFRLSCARSSKTSAPST